MALSRLLATTVSLLTICAAPDAIAAAPEVATTDAALCRSGTEGMLELSPDRFDQDMTGGWRTVAARGGCEHAAADLITSYISRNWGRIGQANLHALYWHAGQMEAFAGDYRQAVPLMLAGVNPDRKRQELGFYEYALGTVAFLDHDLEGLRAARQRLSVLPKPSWYDDEFRAGQVTRWPANLSVLDNLIRCFPATYSAAYAGRCPEEGARR